MNPKLLERAAKLEVERRKESARINAPKFSIELACNGHLQQFDFVNDRSQFIHAMCARQSGKTHGDDIILLDNSLEHSRSTNVFLGIVGNGVKLSNWFPVWKPLCESFGIPDDWHNETNMLTTFDNNARTVFGGTDDLSHIKRYLGNRLHNSIFIIDEAQDQRDSLLHYMLRVLLPPMLTPTSRVILSGVLPDIEAGMFYELATDTELAVAPEQKVSKGWSHHEWGRAANVHTPEAMQQLKDYCKLHNISEDDEQIQRDWYMRRKWNVGATAYKYRREVAGYNPTSAEWLAELYESQSFNGKALNYCHPFKQLEGDSCLVGLFAALPHAGVDTFAFAIDPGATTDRVAIEGWGWGNSYKGVQHVFDWATPRGVNLTTGQIYAMAAVAHYYYSRYGILMPWQYDAGSSQNTIDNLQQDYLIPVVLPAKKADLKGQVDKFANLNQQGETHIIIGSPLEQDLLRAKWDADKRKNQQFVWHSAWHPDPSESGRYGLSAYHDRYKEPKVKEDAATADARKEDELWRAARQEPAPEPWRNDLDNLRY